MFLLFVSAYTLPPSCTTVWGEGVKYRIRLVLHPFSTVFLQYTPQLPIRGWAFGWYIGYVYGLFPGMRLTYRT